MQANKHHTIVPSVETELTHNSQGLVQAVPPIFVTPPIAHHEENLQLGVRFSQLSDAIKTHEAQLNSFLQPL